jgi:HD-GYP domain-containing protein (c-di-GMP phosphodiesterase class II)
MEQKIDVKDLRVGMFVADLDRPWIDTPFLIQGFLIEEEAQIAQLQGHCDWVIVDRQRSAGEEYEAPKVAKVEKPKVSHEPRITVTTVTRAASAAPQRKGGKDKAHPPPRSQAPKANNPYARTSGAARTKVVISAADEERPTIAVTGKLEHLEGFSSRTPIVDKGEGFLSRLFGGVRDFMARDEVEKFDDKVEIVDNRPVERPSILPPHIQLTIYEDQRTVEEELAPANTAYSRTSDLLGKLAEDLKVGNKLEIEQVQEVVDEMVDSMVRNPDALLWVARLREKDMTTYGHGLQVAVYLVAFGRHLGFPKTQLGHLGQTGLLLDIGKIKMPRQLLEKNGPLTPEEFTLIKTHVDRGLEILNETPNFHPDIMDGIAQHHERHNGTGYPFGLAGEAISIFGRMAGITDCFAAMTKRRPYADAISSYEALKCLSGWSGEYFHEAMVEQFIQSVGVFPVGSLVELSSGEVSIVVSHNKVRRLKPRVLVVTGPDKSPSKFPMMLDLLYDPKLGGDKPVYIRRGLPTCAYGLDPREYYLS